MQNLGLNNNLKVGNRTLHIQTGLHTDTLKISTSVFENGVILDYRERLLDTSLPPVQYQNEMQLFHEFVLSDIEMLFAIFERVNQSDHIASLKNMGDLFLKKGFYDDALDCFSRVRVETQSGQCNYELGQTYYEKGDYNTALEYLQATVIDHQTFADLHLLLAKTYRALKSYKFAINHLEKAIFINESYHEAYFYYTVVLLESIIEVPNYSRLSKPENRLHQALDYLNKAITLFPDYHHNCLEAVLDLFNDLDKLDEAISILHQELDRQIRRKKQQVEDSEFYLRFMYGGLDKDEQGIDHYIHSIEKLLHEHPDYPDLRFRLGKAFLVKTWYYMSKSGQAFEKAIELNPDYEKAKKTFRLLDNDKKGFINLLRTILE